MFCVDKGRSIIHGRHVNQTKTTCFAVVMVGDVYISSYCLYFTVILHSLGLKGRFACKEFSQIPRLLQPFFVTLEEFSAFLCIKAVWGIEEKLGYELETVLNSTFCYKLHQRTPDAEPATVL